MIFTNHIPQKPLDEYVECLFHFEGYEPEHSIERLVPDGSINLIIELDDQTRYVYDNDTLQPVKTYTKAWLSGLHKQFISISALPNSELFVIRFKPGGSYPFLKVPIEQLNDQVLDAQSILGDKILDFRQALLGIDSPEEKLHFGENWLGKHIDTAQQAEQVIRIAVENIIDDPSFVNSMLEKVINDSGYSQKQFIQLFKKHVGPTPEYFQRIFRFREVLDKVHQKQRVNWAQLGTDCGYFDQAELIKDFKQFSGLNSKQFLGKQHEHLNFTL